MIRGFDETIAYNNRGVELFQYGYCAKKAIEMFSEAYSSITSCRGRVDKEPSSKQIPTATLSSLSGSTFTRAARSFQVQNLFDQISISRPSKSRLHQLFDLNSLQTTFSIIRIDETIIDILPSGDTKYRVFLMIILYNWGVSCLGLAQAQPKDEQHKIHLVALSLLERANKIMKKISCVSIGYNDFDLCKMYMQLAISYAFWQAHRWSVGKRFLQSKTNMILYQRYCRLVRKVQILDRCFLTQTQYCTAAAA